MWYLQVKVHGLIMLKSSEVPSNTCPTSLRERGMIKLLYNIEFSEAEKLDQGRTALYKALFLLFLHASDHSSWSQPEQIFARPTEASLVQLLNT